MVLTMTSCEESTHILTMEEVPTLKDMMLNAQRKQAREKMQWRCRAGKRKRRRALDLSKIATCDLVRELEKREGVEATTAEPYEDVTVTANGPAIVLVVTD